MSSKFTCQFCSNCRCKTSLAEKKSFHKGMSESFQYSVEQTTRGNLWCFQNSNVWQRKLGKFFVVLISFNTFSLCSNYHWISFFLVSYLDPHHLYMLHLLLKTIKQKKNMNRIPSTEIYWSQHVYLLFYHWLKTIGVFLRVVSLNGWFIYYHRYLNTFEHNGHSFKNHIKKGLTQPRWYMRFLLMWMVFLQPLIFEQMIMVKKRRNKK